MTSCLPMPIVVGAPRSGTTLLRLMLDSHPDLAIPPETGFLSSLSPSAGGSDGRRQVFDIVTNFPPDAPAWDDFGLPREAFWAKLVEIDPFSASEGVRCFYRMYAARFGKARCGDKTPVYCLHLAKIYELLPEAHFIHIIRDGRDVAVSLRGTWFSPGERIEDLAAYWVHCVASARMQGRACPKYLEVRFEDLVGGSEAVLRGICVFLDLQFRPDMLQYFLRAPGRLTEHRARVRRDGTVVVSHQQRLEQQWLTSQPPDRSRVRAWPHALDEQERGRFEAVAGELLEDLGY